MSASIPAGEVTWEKVIQTLEDLSSRAERENEQMFADLQDIVRDEIDETWYNEDTEGEE